MIKLSETIIDYHKDYHKLSLNYHRTIINYHETAISTITNFPLTLVIWLIGSRRRLRTHQLARRGSSAAPFWDGWWGHGWVSNHNWGWNMGINVDSTWSNHIYSMWKSYHWGHDMDECGIIMINIMDIYIYIYLFIFIFIIYIFIYIYIYLCLYIFKYIYIYLFIFIYI